MVDVMPRGATGYVDDGDTWGGVYSRFAEHVPDLAASRAPYVYAMMRRDPQLTGILEAVILPIMRATAAVDPAGVPASTAALVADQLGVPVLGTDPAPTAARTRGVVWAKHLESALRTMLTFGFAPFELEAVDDGSSTTLAGLYERLPHTIEGVDADPKTGALVAATQEKPLIANAAGTEKMLANRLLWYVRQREGCNWRGVSLLRPAYGAWLLKNEMLRVHAISNRRHGAGHLNLEALAGTSPSQGQMEAASRMAQQARAGDQAGGASPPGFRWVLAGLQGTVPDTLAFIRYLDQSMSRMALAGFMDLGETSNGSRALGEEFVDLFMLADQGLADDMADTVTIGAARRIVDWNIGEDAPCPRVVIGDVGADREATAEAIGVLLTSGALTADPALESALRRTYRLPQRDPDAPPPPPPPTPPTPPVPVAAAGAPRADDGATLPMRREFSQVEMSAMTDFEAVHQDWTNALDALVSEWSSTVTTAQADALVAQVAAASSVDALATLHLDYAGDAEFLTGRMTELADLAAAQMRAEAVAQGVAVKVGLPDAERLAAQAKVSASLLSSGLENSAARKGLQAWTAEASPSAVAAAVKDHLAGLSDSALRDQLGQALTAAQNEGRLSTMAAAPVATYFASEVMDVGTCERCLEIDGQDYATFDAAAADYGNGGYAECLGGARCRGIIVAVWDK